jgi:ribosomal protein S18 acetylase RimI-like enzyme
MAFVRKATLNDAETIAALLFLAMEDIVYKFIGKEDREKGLEFMLHFVGKGNNQYSYQNCWVVEEDTKVMAAINLYDGARLSELRQPIIEYLRNKFNKNFNPEDETQEGECYIDSLGVDPNQQDKGFGTKLLRFVIDEYVSTGGQTLGLLVDEGNPKAKRLYLKLGFINAGKKVIFGKNMEHLQHKMSTP